MVIQVMGSHHCEESGMTGGSNNSMQSSRERKPASRGFAQYCEGERERRRTSQEDFDGGLFDEAVELVLKELKGLEGQQ